MSLRNLLLALVSLSASVAMAEAPRPESGDLDEAIADELDEHAAAEAADIAALLEAEADELDAQLDHVAPFDGLQLLGAGHPLRMRRLGAEPVSGAELMPAEGDAGSLVPELAGIDLADLKAKYDIPIEINEDVIAYIRFFQGRGRNWYQKWLARAELWVPLMRPILADEGVPLDLVYLAMIESGFSPYAYSWAGASGFWQFMSPTGKRFGLRDDFWVDERRDPVLSTRAAAKYLKTLHREFDDWYLAWASYNAGEGKMRRAIRMYETRDFWELTRAGHYLRKETKHYVPKLIAAAIIAKHLDRFGFAQPATPPAFEFDVVEVADATDVGVIARAAGVDVKQVQDLNQHLRRWCTPPARQGRGYPVKLPKGTRDQFLAEYAKIAPSERLTYRRYQVKKGDTLGHIAKKYSMPMDAIMNLNGIRNVRHLRIGQDLIIPVSTRLASNHPDQPTTTTNKRAARTTRQATSSRRLAQDVERSVSAPAGSQRYVVRKGDTLWSIAQKFGVEVQALKKWNGLGKDGHRGLQVGRTLYIAPTRKADAGGPTRG